eukprot:TRINITY_DN6471_c0_g1_i7.p1 TRINITY_DN6471_c0_g1~~TRINITY_DN6471_c0_g1_i7.p1  ORF type:complete len:220 (-),score=26.25 TRINITY_DN6471_c0_g1_i7:82-741(-)
MTVLFLVLVSMVSTTTATTGKYDADDMEYEYEYGVSVTTSLEGRKLQQLTNATQLLPEQFRDYLPGFDPTYGGTVPPSLVRLDNGCTDVPPPEEGALECEAYSRLDLCDLLKSDEFCKKSCNKCCVDVEVPGIAGGCLGIVEKGACNDSEIYGNYCQQSCGYCEQNQTSSLVAQTPPLSPPFPAPPTPSPPHPVLRLSQEDALEAFQVSLGTNRSLCTN